MSKVLIVEDDDELRRALSDTLEEAGYAVEVAADGEQALATLAASHDSYLVLLDLILPRMNGWEFRARQLADPRMARHPVVVMSATDNLEQAAIDAADVLRKPVAGARLLEAVARNLPTDEFDDEPKTEPRAVAPRHAEGIPAELAESDTARNRELDG